jgi:hypothetical protein
MEFLTQHGKLPVAAGFPTPRDCHPLASSAEPHELRCLGRDRRNRRRHRGNEAGVLFAPKTASSHRRPTFLSSPCRQAGARMILLVLLLASALFPARLRAQVFKEYDLKAAFLYHLAQFVDWPPEAFSVAEDPLVIGILGTDPFGKTLTEIVKDEVVKNRKLMVQRYRNLDEIKSCHILFISQSETGRLDEIFSGLKGRNILTVGDTEGFAQRGGMVRFVTEKNKIKLLINMDSVKAASLTISSKLLRAAELVGSNATKP